MTFSKITTVLVSALAFLASFSVQSASAAEVPSSISTSAYPIGITQNASGDVFIADSGTPRIAVIAHGTGSVSLYGHNFTGGVEGTLTLAGTPPRGIAIDPITGALVYSTSDGRIYAMSSRPVTLWGTSISNANLGTFVQVGTLSGAKGGIEFDKFGNLFAAGEDNGMVVVLPRESTIFGNSFTPNTGAQLSQSSLFVSAGDFVADVALDKNGNLFVSTMFGTYEGVHVLARSNTTILGHSASASAFTMVTTSTEAGNPCGVDVDFAGRLFIGSWGTSNVYVVSPKTETVFETAVTANASVAITALVGYANQGVSVADNTSVIISGGGSATYRMSNVSAQQAETLANTGRSFSLELVIAACLIAAGIGISLLRRKTKFDN